MTEGTIRIILDGKEDILNVEDFLRVVKATVSVLNSLDDDKNWILGRVTHNSPLDLELHNASDTAPTIVNTFMDAIEHLDKSSTRPKGFNDAALKQLKGVAKPLNNGLSYVRFVTINREPVKVSQRICASVDEIVHSPSYTQHTELEGSLDQITVHGRKAEFCIYDPITDKPVICRFNPEDAEEIGALITHRVRVYGIARYSRDNVPESIDVETWEGYIGENAPSLTDLHNAGFKLKSGESSEGVIRKMRDLDG